MTRLVVPRSPVFTLPVLVALAAAGACDRTPQAQPPAPTAHASESAAVASASASAPIAAAVPVVDPTPEVLKQVPAECKDQPGAAFLASPQTPHVGAPLRILATSESEAPTGMLLLPPKGDPIKLSAELRYGPPPSAFAELAEPEEGTYRVVLHAGPKLLACHPIAVAAKASRAPKMAGSAGAWDVKRGWSAGDEDLYAAWVEKTFDAPIDQQPSYHSLDEITSDPSKNMLHDYLGLGEDAPPPKGMRLHPDCADLPFTLRAYFAWKMRLPFGYSQCTRGGGGRAPQCLHHFTNDDPMDDAPHESMRRFEEFVRKEIGDTVHSGTGRTKGDDDATDYYPVKLAPGALRPGVVYADPYGHTLVVAKIFPQSASSSGVLYAVDGQPDGTVGRKRFWEGNFLFSLDDAAMGGPGFKRFRKLDVTRGGLKLVPNAKLANDPAYADFGMDQYAGSASDFYDHVDDVLNPSPRDPERALLDTIQALEEQVKTRVISVGNGEDRFKKSNGIIPMPDGPTLFETVGEWEDFSTPSRDMRLLIAIDVATGFPARFARRPERYALPAGKSAADIEAGLRAVLDREIHTRKVTYTRMDGSPFTLTLADVIERQKAFEVAYNPNECVEARWGAPEGSDEMKTCKRRAPADQRRKMESVRSWFSTRKRPPRK